MEDLRLAEMAREGHVLLIGDGLIGKHHDQMPGPGIGDLLHRCRIQRPAHVDAVDFRAQSGMSCLDGDGHAGCLANVFAYLLQR